MHSYQNLFHLPHHKTNYLSLLYIVATMRTFIFSMISLFLPILFLNSFQNNGFDHKISLILVILIFLILSVLHLIIATYVPTFIEKYSIRSSFIISFIFLIFFLLLNFSRAIAPLIISSIILGICAAFYWISYHIYFLETGKKREIGKELSFCNAFGILFGLIAPFFGGLILMFFNKQILFSIGIIIAIISLFVLIFVKDLEKIRATGLADIIKEINNNRSDFVAYIGAGAEEIIYSIAWPILLFTVIKSYFKVGLLSSLIVLCSAFAVFLVGRIIDRQPKRNIEKIGSCSVSLVWLCKIFFQTPFAFFILDSLYKVFYNGFYYMPLEALAYSNAFKDNKILYIVLREVGYKTGNIIALMIFLFFIAVNLPFWLIFLMGAVFSLLPMLAKEK